LFLSERQCDMAETQLSEVPGWSAQNIALLADLGIDSAEQVVAISATSGGLHSLAEQLQLSEDEARRLVSLAREALAPETRAEMDQPVDTDERGLGALPPRKEEDGQR
jgi:hypothetical protein